MAQFNISQSCAHTSASTGERPVSKRHRNYNYLSSSAHLLNIFHYVLEVFMRKSLSSTVGSLKSVGSRFGFHNGSSIDSLLDKEDVSLEAILDEDDLLQECKSQNTRLIDYFQRSDVLQRLLGYVTGQIEGEDRGRFKCVAGQSFLAPSNLAFSYLTKIPLRFNRGSLQRNMVDRRDMSE